MLAIQPQLNAASVEGESITMVVRADIKSGRLIRRVFVASGATRSVKGTAALQEIVERASERYGVDPLMVHSIIHVESSYDRFAVSPKGAQGLMQLIPATARRFGVRNSFDSKENIEGGVKYLRYLQDMFQDLRHVIAAYNAGEDAVTRYNGIPPYAETRNYVVQVSRKYDELKKTKQIASNTQGNAAKGGAAAVEFRPLEAFLDEQGRLTLRTR
jgi:soluble lytic murein transglycosylase-like protein